MAWSPTAQRAPPSRPSSCHPTATALRCSPRWRFTAWKVRRPVCKPALATSPPRATKVQILQLPQAVPPPIINCNEQLLSSRLDCGRKVWDISYMDSGRDCCDSVRVSKHILSFKRIQAGPKSIKFLKLKVCKYQLDQTSKCIVKDQGITQKL